MGQRVQAALKLAFQHGVGQICVALGGQFSDANDWSEPSMESGAQLAIYGFVRFAEELAAFGMADNYGAATRFHQHGHGNFAGEGAFSFPMRVLGRNGDRGTRYGLYCRRKRSKWRRDDDFAMPGVDDERLECGKELARLRLSFVHLPIAGDDGAARHLRLLAACGFIRERFYAWEFLAGKKF